MKIRLTHGVFLILLGVSLAAWVALSADEPVRSIPDAVSQPIVPDPALLMRVKLSASQHVLEGLVNQDFGNIQSAAKILAELAESVRSRETERERDQVFEHFRVEFARQATQSEKLAEEQNLEGTAYAHQNLISTCIACHQHLRDSDSALRSADARPKNTATSATQPTPSNR